MIKFLDKFFGGGNDREVTRLKPMIDRINSFEEGYKSLKDSEIPQKTKEFQERIAKGESLDDLLPEAFALVKEAASREINQRHFDVQVVGGIVLNQGKIAEMKTGEGKTLVATLPLYLNALSGRGAHLITVNDYLSKLQGEWMGRIYDRLGLTTGIIQNQGVSFIFERGYKKDEEEDAAPTSESRGSDRSVGEVISENLKPCARREAYSADITYGTNNEYGFDYLRDNMAQDQSQLVQRDLNYAIVDEVDSILIDEARTPLIISSPAEESASLYAQFATIVPRLKEKEDYEIDEKMKAVSLTDEGISKLEKVLNTPNIYQPETISMVHHLEEALKAYALFKKDRDYIVKDGEVIIVDEFTGRLMPGRRYSEGLHQAIEAKEGVEIKRESDTLATISFQNFFRLYDKLSGMTGTAATEAEEFHKIYKLDVVEIPTNRPMIRADLQDQIYKSEEAKFNAIAQKIKSLSDKGQPVLVGTISIEKSEVLSRLLKRSGVKHEVLNAKAHEREAKIIAQAGRFGAVTVATNMAGRGVDILLGGSPQVKSESEKVKSSGGLFVLGTERHESRRIDNQLRGRSGRQGDEGISQFYISMEDDLMRIFGGDRLKSMMERLGLPDDQPIEHSFISKSIESAQRRVEGHNFDIRKQLVDYDDVMNRQREVFYKRRKKTLLLDIEKDESLHKEILDKISDEEKKSFEANIEGYEDKVVRDIEKRIYLSVMDQLWVEHLNTMDQLRDSIGLRGYGQVDPLVAYKQESLSLFEGLMRQIDDEAIDVLLKVKIEPNQKRPPTPPENPLEYHGADTKSGAEAFEEVKNESETAIEEAPDSSVALKENVPAKQRTGDARPVRDSRQIDDLGESNENNKPMSTSNGVVVTVRDASKKMNRAVESGVTSSANLNKVGRNEKCPCGSGKKYKKCCGK
ncbi:MAG: preprotein translocase subunit SecA [bacterium]